MDSNYSQVLFCWQSWCTEPHDHSHLLDLVDLLNLGHQGHPTGVHMQEVENSGSHSIYFTLLHAIVCMCMFVWVLSVKVSKECIYMQCYVTLQTWCTWITWQDVGHPTGVHEENREATYVTIRLCLGLKNVCNTAVQLDICIGILTWITMVTQQVFI